MEVKLPIKGKNIVIIVGDSEGRDGTEEDVQKITNTFENLYNAKIYNWTNSSKERYKELFSDLKKKDEWLEKFKQCNFVAVFCLFHGDTDGRIKIKGQDVKLLKTYFLNPFFKIEQLDGKLKWLIVQACRGGFTEDNVEMDGKERNLFFEYYTISYCTSEGSPSYQFDKKGKIFIQYLCKKLEENAKDNYEQSLESIMKTVNAQVKQYGIDKKVRDFPNSENFHNFRGLFNFYFHK